MMDKFKGCIFIRKPSDVFNVMKIIQDTLVCRHSESIVMPTLPTLLDVRVTNLLEGMVRKQVVKSCEEDVYFRGIEARHVS